MNYTILMHYFMDMWNSLLHLHTSKDAPQEVGFGKTKEHRCFVFKSTLCKSSQTLKLWTTEIIKQKHPKVVVFICIKEDCIKCIL